MLSGAQQLAGQSLDVVLLCASGWATAENDGLHWPHFDGSHTATATVVRALGAAGVEMRPIRLPANCVDVFTSTCLPRAGNVSVPSTRGYFGSGSSADCGDASHTTTAERQAETPWRARDCAIRRTKLQ